MNRTTSPNYFRLLAGILLVGSLCFHAGSVLATESAADAIEAELISSTQTAAPGKPFTVGVFFKIKTGWHIYWQFSGDAGLPPEIDWKLPHGWTAGKILWPVPTRFTEKGPITTFGYKDSVMLMAEITPSKTAAGNSSASIAANVDWLVCHDECVPGKVTLTLNIATSKQASSSKPVSADRFRYWRQQLPVDARSAGFVANVDVKPVDDSGKSAQVTIRTPRPIGPALDIVDWFPSPTENFAVKNPVRTDEKGTTIISFLFKSFNGPIPSGIELESLIVYRDEKGKKRGATMMTLVEW